MTDRATESVARTDVMFTVTFTVATMPATNDQRADVIAWIESVLEAASDDVALTNHDVRYSVARGISSQRERQS